LSVRDAITTVAAWPFCVGSDAPVLGLALLGVMAFGVIRSSSLLAAGLAVCAGWLYTWIGVAFTGLAVT